jgi:histone H3/H4
MNPLMEGFIMVDAKEKKKDRGFVAKAPIRRLMKDEGAKLVAEDAIKLLVSKLEEIGKATTKKAIEIASADKRKRLTGVDIQQAIPKK